MPRASPGRLREWPTEAARGPPLRWAGNDPPERLGRLLENNLTPCGLPPQSGRRPVLSCKHLIHLARVIHSRGTRPLLELFRELERGTELQPTLERYAGLERYARFIRGRGGDRLEPPARLVRGRLP